MVSLVAQTRNIQTEPFVGCEWNQSSSRSMYERGFPEQGRDSQGLIPKRRPDTGEAASISSS